MNVSPGGGGNVEVDGYTPASYPYSRSFVQYTNVPLEAVPSAGYEFANWSGDLTGSINPTSINMTCSKSVTAHFTLKENPGPTSSIGDRVWEDTNVNGIQDFGESGIEDITVNLYFSGGTLAGSTRTGAGGSYSFSSLESGYYYLEFVQPYGYIFSPKDQVTDDTIDSDADSSGRTDVVVLGSDEENLTVDAGLFRPGNCRSNLPLVQGYNLVSLPLIPDDPDIAVKMAGLNFLQVALYIADGNPTPSDWFFYNRPPAPSYLSLMIDGWGFWINMGQSGELAFEGNALLPPPAPTPYYDLLPGWNLIGFTSTIPRLPQDYLVSIAGKYGPIYGFTEGAYFVVGTPGYEYLQPGFGYWIAMFEAGTIHPFLEQIIADITTAEAYTMIMNNQQNSNFVILDVRTPEEFASGHIEDAVNLNYFSPTFQEELGSLAKNRTYLVYCKSGGRSRWTLDMISDLGFREAYNMLGGIIQWQAEGYPIVVE